MVPDATWSATPSSAVSVPKRRTRPSASIAVAMALLPALPDTRVHGHARLEDAARVLERELDGEHELHPLVLHVDVARRELRLLGALGDDRVEGAPGKGVGVDAPRIADLDAAQLRLRDVDLGIEALEVHERHERRATRPHLARLHELPEHGARERGGDRRVGDVGPRQRPRGLGGQDLGARRRHRRPRLVPPRPPRAGRRAPRAGPRPCRSRSRAAWTPCSACSSWARACAEPSSAIVCPPSTRSPPRAPPPTVPPPRPPVPPRRARSSGGPPGRAAPPATRPTRPAPAPRARRRPARALATCSSPVSPSPRPPITPRGYTRSTPSAEPREIRPGPAGVARDLGPARARGGAGFPSVLYTPTGYQI